MSDLSYQDKPNMWSSYSRIAAFLESLPTQSKVLDVGTATGMLARRSEENTTLRFFGIEINSEWAAIALPFFEKLCMGPFF